MVVCLQHRICICCCLSSIAGLFSCQFDYNSASVFMARTTSVRHVFVPTLSRTAVLFLLLFHNSRSVFTDVYNVGRVCFSDCLSTIAGLFLFLFCCCSSTAADLFLLFFTTADQFSMLSTTTSVGSCFGTCLSAVADIFFVAVCNSRSVSVAVYSLFFVPDCPQQWNSFQDCFGLQQRVCFRDCLYVTFVCIYCCLSTSPGLFWILFINNLESVFVVVHRR